MNSSAEAAGKLYRVDPLPPARWDLRLGPSILWLWRFELELIRLYLITHRNDWPSWPLTQLVVAGFVTLSLEVVAPS